jgi:purine nucleosidase
MAEYPTASADVDTMTPLVFIHDAAIDDFVATLLIESMPQFDLKGVIIANADCVPQPGIEVASRVNQFMGRPDLPLGLSKARGWNPFPWPYRGDCIRLGAIPILSTFESNVPTPPPSGDDLLAEMLQTAVETGTPLTILLTTGFTPLTDILSARPELAQGIGRIAWMGGALDVKGNLDSSTIPPEIANTHAEWNVFWDPFAADAALATLGEIAVFPLDITDTAAVTKELMATLQAQGAEHSFSQFAFEAYGLVSDEPFYDMWNVTSTVWLDAPELYSAPTQTPLQVVQWGFEQGWLQPAPPMSERPSHNLYLSFADQPGFYDYVTTRLARSA